MISKIFIYINKHIKIPKYEKIYNIQYHHSLEITKKLLFLHMYIDIRQVKIHFETILEINNWCFGGRGDAEAAGGGATEGEEEDGGHVVVSITAQKFQQRSSRPRRQGRPVSFIFLPVIFVEDAERGEEDATPIVRGAKGEQGERCRQRCGGRGRRGGEAEFPERR